MSEVREKRTDRTSVFVPKEGFLSSRSDSKSCQTVIVFLVYRTIYLIVNESGTMKKFLKIKARITVNFKLDQNLNFNGPEVVGKLSAPNTDPTKVSEENY